MKDLQKIIFSCLMFFICNSSYSQVIESDSLSLVSLYNNTDGDNWAVSWDLQNTSVDSWFGVNLSSDETRVIGINLSNNLLTGVIPDSLYEITELKTLNLSANNLTGGISDKINQLDSLSILDLSNNQLNDSLTQEISNLLNLTFLDLSSNQLTGSIPEDIGNLEKLQLLDLSQNLISDTIPESISNLKLLSELLLNSNNISGNIPDGIKNLTNLTDLNLSSNQISGTLSDSLFYLTNLRTLDLNQNQIDGNISSKIELLDSIELINLSNNLFSDSIPEEIGDLKKLILLDLSNNSLTGPIPGSLGLLDNIETIRLNNNVLSGIFPSLLTSLDQLKVLNISFNNLTDSIPQSITNLKNLTSLNLSNNLFSNLPDITEINNGGVPTLVDINNNELTFEDIEPNISLFSSSQFYSPQAIIGDPVNLAIPLEGIDTIYTITGGQFNIYEWVQDTTLKKSSDNFYSFQNFQLGDTGIYKCYVSNTLVPDLVLEREPFRILVKVSQQDTDALLALYEATGGENWDIDWEFGLPVSLWHGITVKNERVTSINLGSNNLDGYIPNDIKALDQLTSIRLSSNNISGELPDSLIYLINLEILDLSSNDITDSIELQFNPLVNIRELMLSENHLRGNIPEYFNNLDGLEIFDISTNELNGEILASIDSLPQLREFDVSDNRLIGSFPEINIEHQSLKVFHISDNRISGEIPSEISNLKNLEILDISDNSFSGQIPESMGDMISLVDIRFFGNNFTGNIPDNFTGLSNLETLFINNNDFTNLPELEIEGLEELRVYNNRLTFKDILPNLLYFIEMNRQEEFIWEPQENNKVIPTLFLNTGMDTLLISPDITEGNNYRWSKDGVDTGNDSSAVKIDSVKFKDSGFYTCRVTNSIIEELGFVDIYFDFIFRIEVNPIDPVVETPEPYCIGSSKISLKTDLVEEGLTTIWFRNSESGQIENLGQGPTFTYTLENNIDTIYVFNKVGNLNSDTLQIPVFLRPEIYQSGDSLILKGLIENINYSWFFEEDHYASDVIFIQPDNPGNYYVQAIHDNCSSTSEPYFFTPGQTGKIITGLTVNENKQLINIYPNPAEHYINIDINNPDHNPISVEWLDTQGRIIKQDKIVFLSTAESRQYSTNELEKGVYFVIINISGSSTVHKVLVK